MRTSDSLAAWSAAFAEAQKELQNPRASETVQTAQYSYSYPPFDAIVEHARTVLSAHGLSFVQEQLTDDNGDVGVTTRVLHESGEWVETGPLILPTQGGAQQYGSAGTYARRYALTAFLGIAAEKDDDAASSGSTSKAKSGPKPITEAQMKALVAVQKAKGLSDEQVHGYIATNFHKESRKDLTTREASQMLDSMKALPDAEDSVEAE